MRAHQGEPVLHMGFGQAPFPVHDKLAAALDEFGVVAFDARLSANQREAAVQRFREDPDAGVFVATVKSAGVGLTLTEASYVIHFDHWWNPAWMWQAATMLLREKLRTSRWLGVVAMAPVPSNCSVCRMLRM